MAMSEDAVRTRHLITRGRKYYASVRIPESLRSHFANRTHLRQSLRTDRLGEARTRLPVVVGRMRAEIEHARRGPDGVRSKGRPANDPEAEGRYWREVLIEAGVDPSDPFEEPAFQEEMYHREPDVIGEETVLDEQTGTAVLHPVYDERQVRARRAFVDAVRGTRVGSDLDRYLSQSPHSPRYQSRTRLAVRRLEQWLDTRPTGNDTASVTRREAGHYIEHLGGTLKSSVTASAQVSSLSSYWTWMLRRGLIDANPWTGQPPPRVKDEPKSAKRPFTDDEVIKLLSGDTYSTLHDLMRIAALSGLRVGEIGRLTVADCQGGIFNVHHTKTKAGERRVPIHTDLKALVAGRLKGKTAESHLFDELKASPGRDRERTAKASERFTEYRRAIGVDERGDAQRQANADFHSFRRWFITKAEQAGQPPHVISFVAGHAEGRSGMTLGTYSKGPSDEQLRAVVDAVKLPKGAPVASPAGPRMGPPRRRATQIAR